MMKRIEFDDSAFRHGFDEDDFMELLSRRSLKLRSQRGVVGVYDLFGQNLAGDYLFAIYRHLSKDIIQVFHISKMSERQKRRFKRTVKK